MYILVECSIYFNLFSKTSCQQQIRFTARACSFSQLRIIHNEHFAKDIKSCLLYKYKNNGLNMMSDMEEQWERILNEPPIQSYRYLELST